MHTRKNSTALALTATAFAFTPAAHTGDCSPVLTGSFTFDEIGEAERITDVRIGDDALYVRLSEPTPRVHVIDLSDPTELSYAGAVDIPGNYRDMWYDNHMLFTSGNAEGVQIYDCSNPLTPTLVGNAGTVGETPFVRAADDRLYAISSDDFYRLLIYNVAVPSSPVLLSTTQIDPPANLGYETVALANGVIFVEDGSRGGAPGYMIDARDPSSPKIAHTFSGFADLVAVSGDTAVRSPAEGSTVAVYNIEDPHAPLLTNRLGSFALFIQHIYADPPFLHTLRSNNSPTREVDLRTYLYSPANRTDLVGSAPVPTDHFGITSDGRTVYTFGRFPHLARFELPTCSGLCGPADLGLPLGRLSLADINLFLSAFLFQQPTADFAEPFGVLDLADIVAFVTAFNAGCP